MAARDEDPEQNEQQRRSGPAENQLRHRHASAIVLQTTRGREGRPLQAPECVYGQDGGGGNVSSYD
jgi:hypothetical protein